MHESEWEKERESKISRQKSLKFCASNGNQSPVRVLRQISLSKVNGIWTKRACLTCEGFLSVSSNFQATLWTSNLTTQKTLFYECSEAFMQPSMKKVTGGATENRDFSQDASNFWHADLRDLLCVIGESYYRFINVWKIKRKLHNREADDLE